MRLFIEHTEVNVGDPTRGVAVIPDENTTINSKTVKVTGERIYFAQVDLKENKYAIYTVPEEDWEWIENNRELLVKKLGYSIYHDYRNTGLGPSEPELGMYKIPYYKPKKENLKTVTKVDFINPIPHGLNSGIYN